MTTNEMITYDEIVEYGVATSDELNLVRDILDGSWTDIFNAVVYARTGYRTWSQYLEATIEEE